MTTLLDANVLLALGWAHHPHHDAALRWFLGRGEAPWATCLITQSAFLRLSMNSAVIGAVVSARDALALLTQLTDHPSHCFLESSPPLVRAGFQPFADRVTGYRQMTDATLLYVAQENEATLATFDSRLAVLDDKADRVLSVPKN